MSDAGSLKPGPVSDQKPHTLVWSPVYVLLRRNSKFLLVKTPVDFFTPSELEKLRPMESLFVPGEPPSTDSLRAEGRRVRAFLDSAQGSDGPGLAPASFEISRQILPLVGKAWERGKPVPGSEGGLNHLEVAAWADGFCSPVDSGALEAARTRGPAEFQRALLVSGWCVFLATQIGVIHSGLLDNLRTRIFQGQFLGHGEFDELIALIEKRLRSGAPTLAPSMFRRDGIDRAENKLAQRFARLQGVLGG